MNKFKKCDLCPRKCLVDRTIKPGICGMMDKMVVAKAYKHMWEEPPISGVSGSGTIFFSGCNLKCIFCQNHEISTKLVGQEISVDDLANICLNLEKDGAHNINLVTPTHFVPLIVEGIKLARKKGLKIPIVYNTSGYELVDTIKLLDGIIDIYLPDFKYYDDTLANKYSHVKDYFKYASSSLEEMYKQVGKPKFNKDGMMISGIIVRHMMLPGQLEDSKKIIKYLYDTYKDNIYISIMNQYTPIKKFNRYTELNNKVSDDEYDELIDYALDLGIKNAYIQEGGTQEESFIPNFKDQVLPL